MTKTGLWAGGAVAVGLSALLSLYVVHHHRPICRPWDGTCLDVHVAR